VSNNNNKTESGIPAYVQVAFRKMTNIELLNCYLFISDLVKGRLDKSKKAEKEEKNKD